MIYLDYNATTPLDARVLEAMLPWLRAGFGNPSSSHAAGREARKAVEAAREQVADRIGAEPDEIVFTSGGTEANNLAILGTARRPGGGHVITSSIEHPAVERPCAALEREGLEVTRIPVDRDGRIPVEAVREALRDDTVLVTLMHSNNEVGTLEPIEEIAGLLADRSVRFHTDAAQSLGKLEVDVKRLGVDLLSLAGHKFYAPKGVGALYVRRGTELTPVLHGASQERGLRPGTESPALIAALGAAAACCEPRAEGPRYRELTDRLMRGLREGFPGTVLNGPAGARLPNTANLTLPGISARRVLEGLSDRLAASTASACHDAGEVPSGVLKAMGRSDAEALSSIRFSVGRMTTEAEIDEAVAQIRSAASGG